MVVTYFGPNQFISNSVTTTASEAKILNYLKKSINYYDGNIQLYSRMEIALLSNMSLNPSCSNNE